MKRFLVLTYDWSLNFGAKLQAYALQKAIKKLGHISTILRWVPISDMWDDIADTDIRNKFCDKYLSRTKKCYEEKKIKSYLRHYDGLIVGGDQVFRNFYWYREDLSFLRYLGDFVCGKKLLASFGASFGTDTFAGDENLIHECKKLFKRFDKIAVREKSGVQLLKNTFEIDNAVEHCDPVFLLDKDDYKRIVDKYKGNKEKYGYIAYMYLAGNNGLDAVDEGLQASLSKYKIVNINSDDEHNFRSVEAWLNYIQNSDFVITDSFHCVAFAIIFNKPFIVVARDFGGNSRIENILSNLNLQYCHRNSLAKIKEEDLKLTIDWNRVNSLIERQKANAFAYLKGVLSLEATEKSEYEIGDDLKKIRKIYEMNYRKTCIKQRFKLLYKIYRQGKRVVNLIKAKEKTMCPPLSTVKYYTVNYTIQMLKAYGIKNIISSPGCQNAMFNLLVQEDDYFNCISVTDERSAAYVATGIAEETDEPVVITCTGSTASRNWIPALTEAYYRNLPVIAMPFFNPASNEFNLAAQFTDRRITQNDIKSIQVKLPEIASPTDKNNALIYLNAALSTAKYNSKPVIIEHPSIMSFNNLEEYKNFPNDIWSTEFTENINDEHNYLKDKDFAVFAGSHKKFSKDEESAISEFAKSWNIPIFCDHTSNYHGENKVITAKAFISQIKMPNLVVDIGDVSGDYFSRSIFDCAQEIWRVSPNKTFKCRYGLPVKKMFTCSEQEFFSKLKNSNERKTYYNEVAEAIKDTKAYNFPLCNYLIIEKLSENIPEGSILHHGVSNTKRGMNFFEFSETLDISCNVGACGIDGAVSTLIGHSLASPNKKCFGVMGDLTFFYDMNVLQNRDIKNNVRILIINNNKGVEFKIGGFYAPISNKVDNLIASANHNTTVDGWAQSCGFEYLKASTKEEFLAQIQDFCNKEYNKPIIFEVFTKDEDEINAFDLILGGKK